MRRAFATAFDSEKRREEKRREEKRREEKRREEKRRQEKRREDKRREEKRREETDFFFQKINVCSTLETNLGLTTNKTVSC